MHPRLIASSSFCITYFKIDERSQEDLIDAIKNAREFPRQPHQRWKNMPKAFPKAKTKAKELTDDPSLQKFLESGPRKFKKGGRVGKPKGVGAAQRGYGKAMK